MDVTPSLSCSLQGNMGALTNMQPLFLLFLLLKPLQFMRTYDEPLSDEQRERLENFLDDLYATGLMRPPAKETFKSHVIIDSERTIN